MPVVTARCDTFHGTLHLISDKTADDPIKRSSVFICGSYRQDASCDSYKTADDPISAHPRFIFLMLTWPVFFHKSC
ncbi:MAG: hypothetical protein DRI57_23495 [Deltaproteobacteria bacterium]|nr:MAG: hypothetical protein DRI57_23495 [Deltaproteobacteria bacterium]